MSDWKICYTGPDGKEVCEWIPVPTWVVEGGIPPDDRPSPEQWMDYVTLATIDRLAQRVTDETARARLVEAVEAVGVEFSDMLPENVALKRVLPG